MHPLEKELNPEQARAMKTTEGPVLILAGAGSGKTKTLTHRIAYLMAENKIRPQNILAVTFTNKAAGEMRERVQKLLEDPAIGLSGTAMPTLGTFHSVCSRILRSDIEVLGYAKNFTISDTDDQISIIKKAMRENEIDPDQIKPRSVLEKISRAKNDLLDASGYAMQAGNYLEEITAKIYTVYEATLRKENTLDFDDLIALTVRLLKTSPEVLAKYQNLFQYIMVDEYQDTNRLQYTLISMLAGKHRNLFVIGDDYQSIYGWRQADIRNILDFEKEYTDAVVITLDRNYRSTQVILDAAHGVIENNTNQRHKKLWTDKAAGEPLTLYPARDEEEESRFVSQEIAKMKEGGRRYGEFAILYRTNAQSRLLEETFLRASIPYRIIGGLKFYQRKEVKDVVAYLRLAGNPTDRLALQRIVNEPKRGIGEATVSAWLQFAEMKGVNPIEASRMMEPGTSGLREGKIAAIQAFTSFFFRWSEELRFGFDGTRTDLSRFVEKVAKESGYLASLNDGTAEGIAREENAKEFFSVAKKYDGRPTEEALGMLLEEVALASDTDEIETRADSVQLMTIHSAKGLEFPVVFLVGLEEGVFPHSRANLSPGELEEERRLMYVAITRAKEKCYLLHAEQRLLFGSTQVNPPSRFLSEIPDALIHEAEQMKQSMLSLSGNRSRNSFRPSYTSSKKSAPSTLPKMMSNGGGTKIEGPFVQPGEVRPGDMVEHGQFGGGLIVSLAGSIATIAFKRAGVKKMALGIAPIKKM
ncbi:MAG: UvrD-helicase domain-containing protein [Candidatus Moranbacteria bacterium]|nr:UvrD-helicase domain-containing protein [Candidatus Moranbacteria bacterium]